MAVLAPLPPLVAPLAEQLEEYLVRPDLLPIHDTAPGQRSWWVLPHLPCLVEWTLLLKLKLLCL